ncbi:hypothetical protein [Longimicrobium sp.]|jgi:hypothetical protein|uniref:hypothetical protein n=1 Tax=Longimicrobium sp. TaxID=2029185 RepID=UPI002ED8713C
MKSTGIFGKGLRPLPRILALGALALPLGACDLDRLLAVRDPKQVSPEELENAESVPGLYAGALRSFFVAYSGAADDAYLTVSGALSDELYTADTFVTRQATDKRDQQPPALGNTSDVAYARLQLARVNARRAAAAAEFFNVGAVGGAATLPATLATLRAIEGYTYVTLAEGFCGNIPFSVIPDMGPINPVDTTQFRPGISTLAAFDTAIVRMTSALAAQSTSNLAKVGLGRAQLNRGNYQAAAAAVAGVPTTYVFRIEHSANSLAQTNPIWNLQSNGRYGVSNDEGGIQRPDQLAASATPADTVGFRTDEGEGLAFRAYMDPRVAWAAQGGGFAGGVNLFVDRRYVDQNSDVPLASGVEARLIEAEAQLAAGDAAWLTTLNTLRASASTLIPILYPAIPDAIKVTFPQTLAPLTDPGTAAERVDLLFRERALWMYVTGHRLGDMRRLIRQYGRSESSVFPTGTYFYGPGGVFGNDVALPIPFTEINNTQFDPSKCNVDQA